MTIVLSLYLAWARAAPGGELAASGLRPSISAGIAMASAPHALDLAEVKSTVRSALRQGDYPWYDPDSGKLKPLLPRKPGWAKSLDESFERLGERIAASLEPIGKFLARFSTGRTPDLSASGGALMMALLWVALAGLLMALVRLWLRRQGRAAGGSAGQAQSGHATLLAGLAGREGAWNVDPWAEASRRRAAGDLAGAVVYLFVAQLLALDQIGMIRLSPGVTGRQYISGLKNGELRSGLAATLGLFEEAHYGQKPPSAAAFEAAWGRAAAFRRDVLGKNDER